MIETQPLEVTDFTGGITDYFLDGNPNQAKTMDNFIIDPNRRLRTRWGSQLFIDEQIPLGQFRVSALTFLNDDLLTFAQRKVYEISGGSFSELLGPNSDPLFPSGDTNSIVSFSEWQGHLFLANDAYSSVQKIYKDNLGAYQVRNAGLPEVPSGVSIANPAGAGFTYLYAFNLKYTYQVGGTTFIDRGPVYFYPTEVTGGELGANTAVITLPGALATVENWDDANIEIEIARTVNGGTDYFVVDSVTLGTLNYNDNNTDATISANEALYTSAGTFSYDTPPKCKYVHVVNDTGYYANVMVGSDEDIFTVKQSIPGDPDSVPASFEAFTEQEIVGLSSIFDRPIVLCKKFIYRIDNIISDTGVGNMDLRRIDDRAGCVSNSSIVQTHKGLFWAGENAFYYTDGFTVRKISDNINITYEQFVANETRKSRIVGVYDSSNDRVIWSVSVDDGGNEPDQVYVLDLKWDIRDQSTFTTWSGGDSFKPTALAVNANKIYRGDTRGYVFEHSDDYFTDPKIDTSISPVNWEVQTIIHDYKSCFVDFGSKFYRKFVPRILISADNTTNLSLAINSSNDNNRVTGELQPIVYKNNITWGDSLPLWGDATARWNYQGIVEEWRRFPTPGVRCNYKQVQITNATVDILDSTLLSQATVDSTAKTAVLSGSYVWIPGIVDYVISFAVDNYEQEYTVTSSTGNTLVFADSEGSSMDGTFDFKIRGKPKGEVLSLNGYVIHWAYISKSHTPFSAGSS